MRCSTRRCRQQAPTGLAVRVSYTNCKVGTAKALAGLHTAHCSAVLYKNQQTHAYQNTFNNTHVHFSLTWQAVCLAAAGVEDVKARYTFIYRKIDDKWFIAEHHSSAMPEK